MHWSIFWRRTILVGKVATPRLSGSASWMGYPRFFFECTPSTWTAIKDKHNVGEFIFDILILSYCFFRFVSECILNIVHLAWCPPPDIGLQPLFVKVDTPIARICERSVAIWKSQTHVSSLHCKAWAISGLRKAPEAMVWGLCFLASHTQCKNTIWGWMGKLCDKL